MMPDNGERDKLLPPPQERRLTGCLDRKFMTSEGVRWIPRLCVLTSDRLSFAKLYQSDETTRLLRSTDANEMTLSVLREVFKKHDTDNDGSLHLSRSRTARLKLPSRQMQPNKQNVCTPTLRRSAVGVLTRWLSLRSLSFAETEIALEEMKLFTFKEDAQSLFDFLDKDASGTLVPLHADCPQPLAAREEQTPRRLLLGTALSLAYSLRTYR